MRKGRHSEYFAPDDVATIREHRLDFVLRFAFGIIRGDVLQSARYGVWSFHHGDEQRYRGGPPCFWEIYRGDPVNAAILQRLTDRLDSGVVLRKGFLRTLDYSYARTIDQLYFESSEWPAYVASQIRNGIFARIDAAPSVTDAPVLLSPGNAMMLRFFFRLGRNVLRRLLERRRREEWNVGVTQLSPERILAGVKVSDVTWLAPRVAGWAADPIALTENGRLHVFCEEMSTHSGKAHISATYFDGSAWGPLSPIIDAGVHASYPYVFRVEDAIYCVPETCEANEIRLYQARDFPRRWEQVTTLLSGFPAVDSTIFLHGERWWLFCTHRERSASHLYAYYSEALFGPWKPHLSNPVKIDIRGSRPAGPPFRVGKTLYRPAQDSSRTYGGRVVINRMLELTPESFAEEPHSYVEPDAHGPYGRGLHTLCFSGGYCVVDGKRWANS